MPLDDILNEEYNAHIQRQQDDVEKITIEKLPLYDGIPIKPAEANRMVELYRKRQETLRLAEVEAESNPRLGKAIKDGIFKATHDIGLPVMQALGRVLNFDVALTTGLMRGQIRTLKGEGTPLEGFQSMLSLAAPAASFLLPFTSKTTRDAIAESLRENTGFTEVMEEAGVPAGPRFPIGIGIPKFRRDAFSTGMIMPSHVAMGIVEDLAAGRNPIKGFESFAVTATPRGAIGLCLDVLASPITYLSLGSNIPRKMAARLGIKAKDRSAVRFMNQTILTDAQLKAGVKSLKQNKYGRAVIETLDRVVSKEILGGRSLKAITHEAFDDGYRILKPIHRKAKAVRHEINQNARGIVGRWQKKFESWTPEEKLEFFVKMRTIEKAIRKFPERKVSPNVFANPKMNQMVKEINDFFHPLAKKIGMTDEMLYDFYMPAVLNDIKRSYMRAGAPRNLFRTQRFSGAMKKRFKEGPGLIRNPEEAIIRKAIELMRVERINNGLLKWTIKRYGISAAKAAKRGIKEMLPYEVRKVFKGTKFEAQALKESALGEAAKTEKIFLPNEVVESMQRVAKQNKLTTNQLVNIYDRFLLGPFKTYQTVPFPAFHTRNAFSNKFQRFLNEGWKAFKLKDDLLAIQMIRRQNLGGTFIDTPTGKMSLAKALKKAEKRGLVASDSHFVDEIVGGMDRVRPEEITTRVRDFFNLDPARNNLAKLARRVGRDVENQGRLASYIRALQDGYSVNEAVEVAFASLFDYAGGTAFEKSIMKRVIPFYTFAKKNLQLQTRALLKNPGRQAAIFKLMKDLNDEALRNLNQEQREALNELSPAWLKDMWAIPVGFDPQEGPMFMTGFGFAQQDMFDLFNTSGLSFRLSPFISYSFEQAGRAFLSGQAIPFKEKYPLKEARFLFNPEVRKHIQPESIDKFLFAAQEGDHGTVPQMVQKLFGFEVGKRPIYRGGEVIGQEPVLLANQAVVSALQQLSVSRLFSSVRQWQDPNVENTTKFMRFMFGLGIVKQSLHRQQAIEEKTIKREIQTQMGQRGEVGSFDILFSQDPDVKAVLKELRRIQE